MRACRPPFYFLVPLLMLLLCRAAPAEAPAVFPGTVEINTSTTTLTVNGSGFSLIPAENTVTFNNDTTGTVTASTASTLTVGSLTGLRPGLLTCVVTVAGTGSGAPVTVATVVAAGEPTADLAGVTTGSGTLTPPFSPQTRDYLLELPESTTSVTLTAQPAGPGSSLKLNGTAAAFLQPVTVPLVQAENSVTLNVLAGDGIKAKDYRILIVRSPRPGSYDTRWPLQGEAARNALVLPDGGLLIFGALGEGLPQPGITRLGRSGEKDPSFSALPDGIVQSAALLPDGKLLIAGTFQTVNGVPRRGLARLLPDGTPDPVFVPSFDGGVNAIAVHPDGKISVAGSFSTVNGAPRPTLARLHADGTTDPGFAPPAVTSVEAICLQPDGKLLIGGSFTTVGTASRKYVARLDAGGVPDDFNFVLNNTVRLIALQPNGSVLLGGPFTKVTHSLGTSTNYYLTRCDSAGVWDRGTYLTPPAGETPSVPGGVYSILLQCDGRIMAGGRFTYDAPGTAIDLALLAPSMLSFERTFIQGALPVTNGRGSKALTGLMDGRVFAAGDFSIPASSWAAGQVMLKSDAAPQSLTVSGATPSTKITWLREGGAPEITNVTFEISTDSGLAWATLGNATRIPGGWEMTGLTLPVAGNIRARGRTSGGELNRFSGIVETVASFGTATSHLVIEHPAGTPLTGEIAPLDFGEIRNSTTGVPRTFRIRNTGATALQIRQIATAGSHPGDFRVALLSATSLIPPGGRTDFRITFTANAPGPRSASLHVFTSDPVRPFLRIPLTGSVLLSDDARLSSLVLNTTPLDPVFDPAVTAYTAHVSFTASSVTLVPTAAQANATLRVNGTPLVSGKTSAALPLQTGANTVTVSVLAQDGLTARDYTLLIQRALPAPGDPEKVLFPAGSSYSVKAIALDPAGNIFCGSQAGYLYARRPGDGDGSYALSFVELNSGTTGSISGILLQSESTLLAGGTFDKWSIYNRKNILQSEKATNGLATFWPSAFDPGTDGPVHGMALQPDGKILFAGDFHNIAGVARSGLARLNPDGTADLSFDAGADGTVYSVTVQPDGKILAGGTFTSIGGAGRAFFARLHPGGAADLSFDPRPDAPVHTSILQPDGRIIAGGEFRAAATVSQPLLARFHPDGTLDAGFPSGLKAGPGSLVCSLSLQTDGRLLTGGKFNHPDGTPRHLALLMPDGTPAPAFNAVIVDGSVFATALQTDGRILIGGDFVSIGGISRSGSARLTNEPASQDLSVTGQRVEWRRGGSSPEVMAVNFDVSTDGGTGWTPLGSGSRMTGGWKLENAALTGQGLVRARARVTSGFHNASSGIIESIATYPLTPLEAWRLQHFDSRQNAGRGADKADDDGDGLPNLVEYALGLDPLQDSAALLPAWEMSGSELSLSLPVTDSPPGVTLTAEWITNPAWITWTTIPDTGTGGLHRFVLPTTGQARVFVRLRARVP